MRYLQMLAAHISLLRSKGLSEREATERATEELKSAYRYPGNTQRPWDGQHAAVEQGATAATRATIAKAIAKRARKAARASTTP